MEFNDYEKFSFGGFVTSVETGLVGYIISIDQDYCYIFPRIRVVWANGEVTSENPESLIVLINYI